MEVRRWIFAVATFACTGATLVFGVLFYSMYWRYRALFNEEGRHFDGTVVHHDGSFMLIIPAGVFLLLALLSGCFWRACRKAGARRQSQRRAPPA